MCGEGRTYDSHYRDREVDLGPCSLCHLSGSVTGSGFTGEAQRDFGDPHHSTGWLLLAFKDPHLAII